MKVVVDEHACVGHGRCYALAPHVFAPDDMGHCEILAEDIDDYALEAVRIAVASCPEDALELID